MSLSINIRYIEQMLETAKQAKEKHRATSFCESPSTCGGCHFWSGYIACLEDMINGQEHSTKMRSFTIYDNASR